MNNELRLKIAKALGWRCWIMDPGQGYKDMRWILPPGDFPDCHGYGFKVHEVEMPADSGDYKYFGDQDPDWPADPAAALALLDSLDPAKWSWSITRWNAKHYSVNLMQRSTTHSWGYNGETIAEAACLAWLGARDKGG